MPDVAGNSGLRAYQPMQRLKNVLPTIATGLATFRTDDGLGCQQVTAAVDTCIYAHGW
jgi:hypothetical protein